MQERIEQQLEFQVVSLKIFKIFLNFVKRSLGLLLFREPLLQLRLHICVVHFLGDNQLILKLHLRAYRHVRVQ